MTWHRQKELDQGSSAPDKPLDDTLELNSAHPIRRVTPKNKAHRGTKYTREPPPGVEPGPPPTTPGQAPATQQKVPGPNSPP